MTFKKSYVQSNMMRQWDLISTCVPHSWVVFLENSCQDFLFVLLNEVGGSGVSLFSCKAGSHITERYMTG